MSQSADIDQPGYRWVILIASSLILAVIMGQIVNGLSVYFLPLEADFGWDRGDIALINSAGLAGLALGCMVMGPLADRFGVRPLALMGVIATGISVFLASYATALWQLYLLFFVAGLLGGGAVSAPLMALVGNWFLRGAGLAIGIASAGQALGQGGMPFSGAFFIEAFGWRGAMALQGGLTLVLLLPLALLLRTPPRQTGADVSLSMESPTGLPNWLITAWLSVAVVFCCICMSVPLMHLVPLIQGCGYTAAEGGSVLFFMLMVAILGRVAFGRLADIIGALPAYLTASAWQTLLVYGFTMFGELDSFFLYAAVYGFGYAGVMTSLLVSARNLTAPARRATTMGIVMAFGFIGHGIGGWQGGFFYDLTQAYSWTYANAFFAGLINLAIVGSLYLTIHRRRNMAPA